MKKHLKTLLLAILIVITSAAVFTACDKKPEQPEPTVKYKVTVISLGVATEYEVESGAVFSPDVLTPPEGKEYDSMYTDAALSKPYDFAPVTSDIKLYVKWKTKVITFAVSFLDMDGKLIGEVQRVEQGGAATAPPAPEEPGYTFAGWDKDFSNIQSALTVQALYEPKDITITFDAAGYGDFPPVTQKYGTEVTAPEVLPSRPYSEFEHWYVKGGEPTEAFVFDKMPAEDVTLAPYFKDTEFAVSFFDAAAELVGLRATYTYYQGIALPAAVDVKPGLMLEGWYATADFSTDKVTAIPEGQTGEKVFYAKWKAAPATVELTSDRENNTVAYGAPLTLSASHDKYLNIVYEYAWFKGEYSVMPESGKLSSEASYAITDVAQSGIYTVFVTAKYDGSAETSYAQGSAAITPARLTVHAQNYTGMFDGESHSININVDWVSDYTVEYSVGSQESWSAEKPLFVDAGNYIVNYRVSKTNYATATGSAEVNIAKANMDFSVSTYNGVYTGAARSVTVNCVSPLSPTIEYSENGIDFVSENFSYTAAGRYKVYIRLTADNYNSASESAEIIIDKAPMSVNISGEKVYDKTPWSKEIALSDIDGLVSGDSLNRHTVSTLSSNAGIYTAPTDFSLAFTTVNGIENYEITYVFDVTIKKAEAVVSAQNVELTYGDSFGGWNFVYGLIDETPEQAGVVGTPAIGFDYSAGVSAGTYSGTVNVDGLSAQNYVFKGGVYSLTVLPYEISVTAGGVSLDKSYDGSDTAYPIAGIHYLFETRLGDKLSLEFSAAYPQVNASANQLEITVDFSGAVTSETGVHLNYTLAPVSILLNGRINKADPQFSAPTGLTADTSMKLSDIALPAGFAFEADPSTSVGGVGENKFTVTYTPDDVANYNVITGIEVTVSVVQSPLSALTYSGTYKQNYSAFDNFDTTGFIVTAHYTDGTETIDYKDYAIRYSGGNSLRAGDTSIVIYATSGATEISAEVSGLTVAKRKATVTADDKNVVYADALPVLTYSEQGFVGADTLASVAGAVVTLKAEAGDVGTSDITFTQQYSSDNYEIKLVSGVLTVLPRPVTVTLKPSTFTYNGAMQYPVSDASAYSAEGLANGHSVEGLTYTAGSSRQNVGRTVVEGNAVIIKSGGVDVTANYTIGFVSSYIEITPAALTVKSEDDSYMYGSGSWKKQPVASGLADGEKLSGWDVRGGGDSANSYTLVPFGATVADAAGNDTTANYAIDYQSGTLTVTKRPVTITASQTVEFGKPLGSWVFVYDGFFGSDSETNIGLTVFPSAAVDYEPSRTPVKAEPYTGKVTVVNMSADNYTFTGGEALLTVVKATPVMFVSARSYDYDGAVHGITESDVTINSDQVLSFSMLPTAVGGVYTVVVTALENENWKQATASAVLKILSAELNGEKYTLEDALAKGGTITLLGDTILNSDAVIKSGTTLILPSDADSSGIGKPTYGAGVGRYVDKDAAYIKLKLTVADGVTLTVNGNINIRGLLGVESHGLSGHTSGNHSQIVNNGTINLNSGAKLDVKGYIKGGGKVNINSGATVYSPFVVIDFRGGGNTTGTYQKKITPFNRYELPNIQCGYKIFSGAVYNVYLDLYASSQHNTDMKPMISADGVVRLQKDAYMEKSYDAQGRTTLTIVGNVNLESMELSVIGFTASMAEILFPINLLYTVNIGDGATPTTMNAPAQYKLMPGSVVKVSKNATVNIGNLVIYDEFKDVINGVATLHPYPSQPGARLILEGTLNITGALGGVVPEAGEGGKLIMASGAQASMQSAEGFKAGLLKPFNYVDGFPKNWTARLKNADGSPVNVQTGTTYTYNNGVWA